MDVRDAVGEVIASFMKRDTLDHYRRERDEKIRLGDPGCTGHYEGCLAEADEFIVRLAKRGGSLSQVRRFNLTGRCKDCSHWVTHTGFLTVNPNPDYPSDRWFGFRHVLSEWRDEFRGDKGRCYRANDDAALMSAECMSEGISGELVTSPDFGCIEYVPMLIGWDHYRLYRVSRHVDDVKRHPIPPDDMAHVEGRILMPVTYKPGLNIVDDDADILVCTANCVGVMGKGVALAFARKWPGIVQVYKGACSSGAIRPGMCLLFPLPSAGSGARAWAALATKDHWRNPSRMDWVRDGLIELGAVAKQSGFRSIAIPPPGCGNGGLDWREMEPIVLRHLGEFDLRVHGESATANESPRR